MKPIKPWVLNAISSLIVGMGIILSLIGYPLFALVLFCSILVFLLSNKLYHLIWLIILLTPLGINFSIPGLVRLSIPNEILLLFTTGLFTLKVIAGYKPSIKFWKHPISLIILIDVFWTFCTALTSELFFVSIKRLVLKTIFILIFFYLTPHFLNKNKTEKWIFQLYGIGIIIPIIWATYQHLNLGIGYDTSLQVSFPFFDEHTIYAACVTFIIPYFAIQIFTEKNYKLFNVIALAFLLLAFVLSYSRAAWLSLIISALLLIPIWMKFSIKQFGILGGVILVAIALSFNPIYQKLAQNNSKYNDEVASHLVSVTNLKNDASNLERINRWICAFEMFKDRPLLGYGPGTYQFVYDKYQHPQYQTRISTHHGDNGNAHSEYLMSLSESGILGFLILIGLFICCLYFNIYNILHIVNPQQKGFQIAILLGLSSFFVHGLFNSFIDSSKISILVYASMGFIAQQNCFLQNSD